MEEDIFKSYKKMVYKAILQFSKKFKMFTVNQISKDVTMHFSKEDLKLNNEHMKRYSTSLVTRGMQIKTPNRHYFTFSRTAIIKKMQRYWTLPTWLLGTSV